MPWKAWKKKEAMPRFEFVWRASSLASVAVNGCNIGQVALKLSPARRGVPVGVSLD